MTEIIIEKVNKKSASKPKAASKPNEEKPKKRVFEKYGREQLSFVPCWKSAFGFA